MADGTKHTFALVGELQGILVNTLLSAGHGQRMPLKVVIQTGIHICRGLQDAHAAGMVMRNLSQVCNTLHHVLSA